jgi:type IV pilus assembly protein PilC
MLSAGMPIVSSLKSLEKQTHNPNFRAVVERIRRSIENGKSLTEALRQFPLVFDGLYRSMVQCGESVGRLPETIGRLADLLEDSIRLRRKIQSAMAYPLVVLCIAAIISTVMIVFIVPVFADMFSGYDQRLPAPTLFLLHVSNAVRSHGIYIGGALLALTLVFARWKTTSAGRYALDVLVLKIPVFGDLVVKVASARFARSFSQLLRGGVPILTALDVVAGATGNEVTRKVVLSSKAVVKKGDPLSMGMLAGHVFPETLVEMIQAGEQTGKLDEMLDCVAGFYEDETNTTLNSLTALLEPMLMVMLGVIIGGIVISLFLPIFLIGPVIGQ